MAEFIKTNLEIEHKFNTISKRHYLNGIQSVYHCHHYTSLYTQLAIDANETELLVSSAEESFFEVLSSYYTKKNIVEIQDKIDIAKQYYSVMGLGKIEVLFIGDESGEVKSEYALLDSGWIKKWGKFDKPVNYIGCGFISAMFSAILSKPVGTYRTTEAKSIVMGDDYSLFKTVKK